MASGDGGNKIHPGDAEGNDDNALNIAEMMGQTTATTTPIDGMVDWAMIVWIPA